MNIKSSRLKKPSAFQKIKVFGFKVGTLLLFTYESLILTGAICSCFLVLSLFTDCLGSCDALTVFLMNLFLFYMQATETTALTTTSDPPKVWECHVDDVFFIIRKSNSHDFFQHINSLHSSRGIETTLFLSESTGNLHTQTDI